MSRRLRLRPRHGRHIRRRARRRPSRSPSRSPPPAHMLEHGITQERLLPSSTAGTEVLVTAPSGAVRPSRDRGGHRALQGHRHRPGQLHRRPVLAAFRVAAGREGAAFLLRAAPAALRDRGRHADRDRGARRPDRRQRRPGRPVHRGDPRRALRGPLRPDARRGNGTMRRRSPNAGSQAAASTPWRCCPRSLSRLALRGAPSRSSTPKGDAEPLGNS